MATPGFNCRDSDDKDNQVFSVSILMLPKLLICHDSLGLGLGFAKSQLGFLTEIEKYKFWCCKGFRIVIRKEGHDRDRMVVGFTTTYAISAYHH